MGENIRARLAPTPRFACDDTVCIFADNYNNLRCAESLAAQVHRLHICASFALSLSLAIHVAYARGWLGVYPHLHGYVNTHYNDKRPVQYCLGYTVTLPRSKHDGGPLLLLSGSKSKISRGWRKIAMQSSGCCLRYEKASSTRCNNFAIYQRGEAVIGSCKILTRCQKRVETFRSDTLKLSYKSFFKLSGEYLLNCYFCLSTFDLNLI